MRRGGGEHRAGSAVSHSLDSTFSCSPPQAVSASREHRASTAAAMRLICFMGSLLFSLLIVLLYHKWENKARKE